jgi:hypothetical protein
MDTHPAQATHLDVLKSKTANAMRTEPSASAAWTMISAPEPTTI